MHAYSKLNLMFFIDDGLIHNKLKQTVDQTGLAKPLAFLSSSWEEPDRLTVENDPGDANTTVSDKQSYSVHTVKKDTAAKDRQNEIQSNFASQTSEQNTNIGGTSYSIHVGGNVAIGTSLSVERKAECLDLQSLVKDLESQNQKLSQENEKLLNKLSVQTKVWAKL